MIDLKKNDVTALRFNALLFQLLFPCLLDSHHATKDPDETILEQPDKLQRSGSSSYSEEDLPDDLLLFEEDEDDVYDLYRYDRGGDFISDLSVIPETTNTTCSSTTTFCNSDITSISSHDCVASRQIVIKALSLLNSDEDKNDETIATDTDVRDDCTGTVRSLNSISKCSTHNDNSSKRTASKTTNISRGNNLERCVRNSNSGITVESSSSSVRKRLKNKDTSLLMGDKYEEETTITKMDVLHDCQSACSSQKYGSSSLSGASIVSDDSTMQHFLYCQDVGTERADAAINGATSSVVSRSDTESMVKTKASTITKFNENDAKTSKSTVDGRDDNASAASCQKIDGISQSNNALIDDVSSIALKTDENYQHIVGRRKSVKKNIPFLKTNKAFRLFCLKTHQHRAEI